MRKKLLKLFSGILMVLSLFYLYGVAGTSDYDNNISLKVLAFRGSIGLAALAFDVWLIDYSWKEEHL